MSAKLSDYLTTSSEQPDSGYLVSGSQSRRLGRWSLAGERMILRNLFSSLIRRGKLIVIGSDGSAQEFGDGQGPAVTMRIGGSGTARRMLLNPGLEFGEAYMDGRLKFESGDIYDFLDLGLSNLGWQNAGPFARLQYRFATLARRFRQHNPLGIARRNVAHHYDLSGELYELFLDSDRQYSCAYYQSPDDTLEQAQEQKKRHIAAKLLVRPGDRVLDIGSGWGGMALYLARECGADVTGVTLSEQQHAVSERRAAEAGAGRVRFRLQDYREESGTYDRIVSVGMLEHVGVNHYREYFRKIADLLADDGVALVHTIGRAEGPGATNEWIRKYIFPGGYSPAMSELLPAIERAELYVTDIEVLRLHYAETLKAWRERFLARREAVAKLYDERFCRMWEFYLAGCEATFRYSGHINFQIQLSKRVDAVPLTRDYIGAWERSHEIGGTLPMPGLRERGTREMAMRAVHQPPI